MGICRAVTVYAVGVSFDQTFSKVCVSRRHRRSPPQRRKLLAAFLFAKLFLWAFGVKEKAGKRFALTTFSELSGCKLNILTLNYAHLNPLPAFL